MNKVAFIGAGKVGTAVSLLLKEKGWPIVAVSSRSADSALKLAQMLDCRVAEPEEAVRQAEVIFITTPDMKINSVALEIAQTGAFNSSHTVIHMSGALSSEELAPAKQAGSKVISVHPLQSFADIETAKKSLPGTYFAVEGDQEAYTAARAIVTALQGKIFFLDKKDKPLYHAAACIASNYLVSLLHASTSILQKLGLSQKESIEALFPLLQGTLSNNLTLSPVQALTGPIARGDINTVAGHLVMLPSVNKNVDSLYRQLGLYTVLVAKAKGTLDDQHAAALENLLRGSGDG